LVNNAAAAIYVPLVDYRQDKVRLTFEVNVVAPMDLAQQAIPGMRQAGERWIVNVSSSTAQLRPGPHFSWRHPEPPWPCTAPARRH
jgi:NAD(P)-dependent dehydrogenase (short-subunit alcohol dehydrogenase family)